MTKLQKDIIKFLLDGYTISMNGKYGNRMRDAAGNPVMKIGARTIFWMRKDLMRRDKKTGLMVIDKRKVRSLHGNCFAKKIYKSQNKKG